MKGPSPVSVSKVATADACLSNLTKNPFKSINNIINVINNGKIPTQALVDTGPGSSCVNEQYVKDNKMTINRLAETDDHAFNIADKTTIKVIGKAHIQ